jgi:hypothetical protein
VYILLAFQFFSLLGQWFQKVDLFSNLDNLYAKKAVKAWSQLAGIYVSHAPLIGAVKFKYLTPVQALIILGLNGIGAQCYKASDIILGK